MLGAGAGLQALQTAGAVHVLHTGTAGVQVLQTGCATAQLLQGAGAVATCGWSVAMVPSGIITNITGAFPSGAPWIRPAP